MGIGSKILLAIAFCCAVVGSALLWRVYDDHVNDQIRGNLQRLAQYESCSFVFFWIANLVVMLHADNNKGFQVMRTASIGILLYTTVYGDYVNFNNLNNLRIVKMGSNSQSYYIPHTTTPATTDALNRLLGGLILGYISLLFGLISSALDVSGFSKINVSGKVLWFIALIIAIPGVVVTWASPNAAYNFDDGINSTTQNLCFQITTIVIVEWVVLTVGMFSGAVDLMAASAFIFGVGGLYIPVAFFFIQSYSPSNADYSWAGPILCWISTWVMAVAGSMGVRFRRLNYRRIYRRICCTCIASCLIHAGARFGEDRERVIKYIILTSFLVNSKLFSSLCLATLN